MKTILLILIITCGLFTSCIAQSKPANEFGVDPNGLIYSDNTIHQLKFIVDSLNLKYKTCDLTKVYRAKPQASANYISLEGSGCAEAKKDMDAGISYEAFTKKFTKASTDTGLLVVKFSYKEEGREVISFSSVELGKSSSHEIEFNKDLKRYELPLKGKWVYYLYPKDKYSKALIEAFYFTEELSVPALPEKYAKMVQYSDCMVDTTASIYLSTAKTTSYNDRRKYVYYSRFTEYVNTITELPEYDRNDKKYYEKYRAWDSLRLQKIDAIRKSDPTFDQYLKAAYEELRGKGESDTEFEEYLGRYYSKAAALEFKRSRRVVGQCSMDQSPRFHALDIAKLSAETANWEVFLRAHLDIMNDKFERLSDGSYAWGERNTYIKELEVLDINVQDLLLGITLRIDNPAENHYYGSISRLGRSLAETVNSKEIEAKMLEMVGDQTLDNYNRVLAYYLFLNYNYNLPDKTLQKKNEEKLNVVVKSMPGYLAEKMLLSDIEK